MLHRTACIIAYYWKLIKVSAVLTFYRRQSRDEKSGRSASADISVLFFSAGANFRAMHAKKNQQLYQHQCYQHCDHTNVLIVYWAHTVKICRWNERKPLWCQLDCNLQLPVQFYRTLLLPGSKESKTLSGQQQKEISCVFNPGCFVFILCCQLYAFIYSFQFTFKC